jgi:hypothetical protein
MKKRAYLVGHYQYNTMRRPATAAVRHEDVDCLPPTMFEVVTIWAANKREAVRLFRQAPQYCSHGPQS